MFQPKDDAWWDETKKLFVDHYASMTKEGYLPNELIINAKGRTEIVPGADHTIISKPEHQFGLTTFSEYVDIARRRSTEYKKESLWRSEVKIDIKTPHKWFGIQPWCDFHIGSHGCDYNKLEELLAGPMTHDNLKVITLANLGDFFTPMGGPKDGIIGDVMTMQTQVYAIKKFVTEQQDNILSSYNAPDHEDWVYRSSGIDLYEMMTHELNIPLVAAGGITEVTFNGVTYDIMGFHKIGKFKSALNLTNGHKRALDLHRDADVVMAGHTHKPDYEWAWFNDHEVSLIQAGTLETEETGSMYGRKEGFLGKVRSYFPVVLFNTEKKQMTIVPDVERAEPYLNL